MLIPRARVSRYIGPLNSSQPSALVPRLEPVQTAVYLPTKARELALASLAHYEQVTGDSDATRAWVVSHLGEIDPTEPAEIRASLVQVRLKNLNGAQLWYGWTPEERARVIDRDWAEQAKTPASEFGL